MKRRKNKKLYLLLLLVLGISIGYAALASNLKINGTSKVSSATWNIHWENVQINENSVSTSEENKARITDEARTEVEYSVELSEPGDFYEFTVDAKNDGTLDAQIYSVESKYNDALISDENKLPEYISYTITYEDGTSIEAGNTLDHGQKQTYKVKILYREDIDSSKLPQSNVTLDLKFKVEYRQKEKNANSTSNDDGGKITLTNPTVKNRDDDVTYYTESWINDNAIYYDPTIPAVCTREEYEANTTEILSNSGCMKWYAYSTKDNKTKLLLDHNLYLGEYGDEGDIVYWISNSDGNNVVTGNGTEGITFTKERDASFIDKNYYGPQTALKVLGQVTNHWKTSSYSEVYHQEYSYSSNELTIDYTGYKAIFLTHNEILNYSARDIPRFIYDNLTSEEWYWTASPDYIEEDREYMAFIIAYDDFGESPVDSTGGIRPVIIVPSESLTD